MKRLRVGSLALCLAGTACGGEDEQRTGLGAPPIHAIAGCETIDHASCDVRDEACRERLLVLTACLREDEAPPMPPVTIMNEAEFADYLYSVAEEPPEVNHFERALVGLGMVEPGAYDLDAVVNDVAQNVDGVYRTEPSDILIIDHGSPPDFDRASSVLVHEFVHYLQDREVDLDAFYEAHALSADSTLATTSVVEGEAELHQVRYYASQLGLDPNAVNFTQRFEAMVGWSESYLLEQASPYARVRNVFPYAWGGRYMQAAWAAGGRESMAERYAEPPAQTRTLMTVNDGMVEADVETVAFESIALPSGLYTYADTTGGAFMAFLFLAALTTPGHARDQAIDWRGDRFSIFANDDDSGTVVVWRLAFVDAAAAARFASTARQGFPTQQVVVNGARVVIAIADPTVDLDWALSPAP